MEFSDVINSLIVLRQRLKIVVKSWLFLILIQYYAKSFAPREFSALPPAIKKQFQSLKVTELKAIATRMALPNRSKVKRKADIIQFLITHQAPLAPSYE